MHIAGLQPRGVMRGERATEENNKEWLHSPRNLVHYSNMQLRFLLLWKVGLQVDIEEESVIWRLLVSIWCSCDSSCSRGKLTLRVALLVSAVGVTVARVWSLRGAHLPFCYLASGYVPAGCFTTKI